MVKARELKAGQHVWVGGVWQLIARVVESLGTITVTTSRGTIVWRPATEVQTLEVNNDVR